jgi:hypothetical protein
MEFLARLTVGRDLCWSLLYSKRVGTLLGEGAARGLAKAGIATEAANRTWSNCVIVDILGEFER